MVHGQRLRLFGGEPSRRRVFKRIWRGLSRFPGHAPSYRGFSLFADVLVAADTAGSGHRWRLIDDQPWPRFRLFVDAMRGSVPRFFGVARSQSLS